MFKSIKSDFFINIFTLLSGTVIAQLIPILLQPFLRRMYLPEDFGLLGVYSSIVSIVTVLMTFRYSQTINIPNNDIVAINIFALSIFIATSFTTIITIIILIFGNTLIKIIGISQSRSAYLFYIPLSSFLFSIYEIINFWLIRKKEFKLSALNKIYRRLSEGLINLSFGVKGIYYGLIAGDIFGNIVNVVSGLNRLKNYRPILKYVSKKRMFYVAKRFSDMPKYNLLPQLLNSMCIFLPAIFINKLYSSQIAGYFNLTMLVLNIPIVLIGNSISEVLTQRLSEKRNKKLTVKREIKKIVKVLAIVSLLMIIIITISGSWLFTFVFGSQWQISGQYAKIFVWASAFRLVASPLNIIFVIFEKVKAFAFWQICYFIFTLFLVFFGFLSFEHFLILISLINAVFYTIVFLMSNKVINNYEKIIYS